MNLLINPATNLPILMINATSLKDSGCMRRFKWIVVDGLTGRNPRPKPAIEYGIAFHQFLADRFSGKEQSQAIFSAGNYLRSIGFDFSEKEFRTPEHLIQACLDYEDEYRFDTFKIARNRKTNEALVEQKFAIELEEFAQTLSFHVILIGTIDAIGFANNELVIMDHKTTSVWDKDTYLESYRASPQLKFYTLVLRKYAQKFPETFGEFTNIGSQINGIFLTKAGAKFKRSEIFNYSDEILNEFELMLKQTITELILLSIKTGIPAPYGMIRNLCNSAYGTCPFFSACTAPGETSMMDMLEAGFRSEVYDPRKFGGGNNSGENK